MHRDQIAGAAGDPDEIRKLEERYLEDRRRVDSNLEAKIARVKRGEESDSDED